MAVHFNAFLLSAMLLIPLKRVGHQSMAQRVKGFECDFYYSKDEENKWTRKCL